MALTPTTWNPSDKGGACTLSNGNLKAVGNQGNGWVRSVFGASSGKWYWELKSTGSRFPIIGIATASAALGLSFMENAVSWGFYGPSPYKGTNKVYTTYGLKWDTSTRVIGVALDMDAGTIELFRDGTSMGVMFSGITGTIYAVTEGDAGVLKSDVTANFGATAFAYSPPSGFTAGFGVLSTEVTGIASTIVSVGSAASAAVSVTGAGSSAITVTSAGTGAAKVTGQAAGVVGVTSVSAGAAPAQLSGSAVIAVTSDSTGSVAVAGSGTASVTVISSAEGVVRSDAILTGDALVEVSSAATGAVAVLGEGTANIEVASSATAGVRVACAASGAVNVESVATGVLVVTGGGNAAVEVGSSAHGAVAVRAEAGATINVSSNALRRVGLRDFTLDVSVTTMLREISARTEPLSVVAMTAQRQVNATTKKQEVAVTA